VSTVKRVQSVANACRVFEAVAARQPIGVSELARETGIDKSGVHRIAVTLHEAGWLQPTSDRPTRWQLNHRIVALVRSACSALLLDRARQAARDLRDATGETVLLVAPEAGSLVVVDVAGSGATVASTARVGDKMPLFGASASAWFAALPPGARSAAVHAPEGALDLTLVDDARRRGFAVFSARDVTSIGAAVVDAAGDPIAVLVVLVPDFRASRSKVEQFGRLVRAAADAVSRP